jgi:transposase
VIETNERALRKWLGTIATPRSIAIEECAQSTWLYEVLSPLADRVVVTIGKKKSGTPKDDARDARGLAEDLRTGAIKRAVFKDVRSVAPLRATVRAYQLVRQDVVRTENRLLAVFRSRGIRPDAEVYGREGRERWMRRLPSGEAITATLLGKQLDALMPLYNDAKQAVTRAARSNHDAVRLQTLPEIGPIRAATIVALVVTPWRFRTTAQFWAYCGFGIVRQVSDEWKRSATRGSRWVHKDKDRFSTRGLNRNRNAWLKDAYKGAALALAAKHPAGDVLAQRHRRRLRDGIDPEMSLLTMARQIAEISLLMWKNKEDYDPERLKTEP